MPNTPPSDDFLWLPPDRPLDAEQRAEYDEQRLQPLIDELYRHLNTSKINSKRKHADTPRIGIFGGLGQGKSTVVFNVIERLQRERTWRDKFSAWLQGERIVRFDVSYFKADDLEWRFVTAVLWRRLRRSAMVTMLLTFVAVGMLADDYCVWQGIEVLPCFNQIRLTLALALSAPILILISGLFASAWKRFNALDPSKGLYLSTSDLFIQTLAHLIPALPEVIVVDDLDRASVAQQRSFLRTLLRFSRELKFAVVVCMDESELLAAPPDPEAPDELLRKTLTVELRIPDRTREDVVLLAVVCAREFAKHNRDHFPHLAANLCSTQFVADLVKVLLLESRYAPVSPRKIWRLLTHLVTLARQLSIHKEATTDDLSALLRADSLCRIAPPLRSKIDNLRECLENNRLDAFMLLLGKCRLNESGFAQALDFFEQTRAMQPAVRDGWFRLLAAFRHSSDNLPQVAISEDQWVVEKGSIEFYREFIQAIEWDVAGYEHSLILKYAAPPTEPTDGHFILETEGGYEDKIADANDLPASFRQRGKDYFCQCWLLWVCSFVQAPSDRKEQCYHRARRWIETVPETIRLEWVDLFWRECLADVRLWDGFSKTQRQAWWDLAHADAELKKDDGRHCLPIRSFFALPLRGEDFADAWRIVGREGSAPRDSRLVLFWWGRIVPIAVKARLKQVRNANFPAHLWPAPQPERNNSSSWRYVLEKHFITLNAVNEAQRETLLPKPLLVAWRRAQPILKWRDCLDLIHCLAYDTTATPGLRWGIQATLPWINELDAKQQNLLRDALAAPTRLTQTSPTPPPDLITQRQLTLVLIALLRGWDDDFVEKLARNVSRDPLKELVDALDAAGEAPDWLKNVIT